MKRFLAAIMCLCLVVCMLPVQIFAAESTVNISFASTAQRLSQTSTQQVWSNGDVVFTNNKSASTNAIIDSSKPVRLYANSEIVVDAPEGYAISKIVFDANSSTYATDLNNSIGTTATTSVSSDKVTVTFEPAVASFTVAKLTKQVRLDAMDVTLVSTSTEEPGETPEEPETPESSETEATETETTVPPVSEPTADTALSIAEALALGAQFEHNTYTAGKYYVTGTVKEVTNTTHGNMYIQDAEGNAILVYGTFSADGSTRYDALAAKPIAGNTVTVYGIIGNYNGAQMKNGWIIETDAVEPEVPETSETPSESTPAGESNTAVLDLTSTATRTFFDTTKQVWEQNGIVLTNDKASSSSAVADYSDPARFYAGSDVTMSVPGKLMTQICIYATASKNAQAYADTITANGLAGVTATLDGTTVVIAFAEPVETLVLTGLKAQARASTVTVTLVADGDITDPSEEPTETPSEEPSETPSEEPTETPSEEPTETPSEEPSETPSEEPEVSNELVLDLSVESNGLMVDGSQIWEQNGIKITNNQGESTTAVKLYAPARFYANSELIIEVPGKTMSKIVVLCAEKTDRANALVNSVKDIEGVSAVADGMTVTIVFETPVAQLHIAKLTAQTRFAKVTITVVGGDTPVVPSAPSAIAAAAAFKAEYADFAADTVLPTTYTYKDHEFTVAWAIEATNAAAAYIEDGVLKIAPQADFASYTLTATLTLDADSASVDYTGTVNGTVVDTEATISFADSAFRTVFNTEQQVWNQNNITVTNNKASSSNNVADYSNPVRFYKGTEVIVEYPAMLSIVFTCNSYDVTAYTNALKNSIDASAVKSVEVLSNKVTVVFNEPVDSFTIASLSAASRLDSITVSQEEPEEVVIPDPIETTVADAAEIGAAQETNAYTLGKYIVTGTVTLVENGTYGNLYIEDEAGDKLYIYGVYNADGTARYDKMDPKPVEGDTITVMGVMGNHNDVPQMKNGWVIAYTAGEADPVAPEHLTINEFLAKCVEGGTSYTSTKYSVTGQIVDIAQSYYGNMTICDEEGDVLYIYGAYSADGSTRFGDMKPAPKVGDIITILGVAGQYSKTTTDASTGESTTTISNQMKNGWILEHEVAVAKVENTYYFSLNEAIAATAADSTLTLIGNATETAVEIPAGITLDLAGFTVTADSVASFGQIVDSSNALGGIAAANFEATGNALLPLLDNGTYRFFEYSLNNLGSKYANVGAKFGFAIDFANAKAYELIAGADSVGLTVSMTLTCGDISATYAFDATLVKAYAELHIANPGRQAAMILTVSGLDAVEAGTVLSVAASVAAAGNINVTADAMTYTK